MKIIKNNDQSGSALIFTLLILFILSILGSALISVAMTNFKITNNSNDYNAAYYLADGVAEKMAATVEVIIENAANSAENEINGNSSVYIMEIEAESYKLKNDLKDDAYDTFLEHVKDGSSENSDYGLENIEATDLKFATDFSPEDYSLSVKSIEYDDSEAPDELTIELAVAATYKSAKRSIELCFEITTSYTIIDEEEIEADNNGIEILEKIDAECGTTWKEININQ